MERTRVGAAHVEYAHRGESNIDTTIIPRSAGARQSTRNKLPWPEDRNFNILCVDGGGIKGILPAAVLAGLEQQLADGTGIVDYFDLIAGTSTGGIVALGLANGRSAQNLLDLYVRRGGEIFPPSQFPRLRRCLRGARGPIFDRRGLDRVLREEFGETGFWEATTRLCVPAVEGAFGEVHIYKTPHHPDYKRDWRNSMCDVARATSAAPVFLEAVEQSGYALVDGGLFANNPVMVALVDALACYDVPRERVRVLSLGCLDDSWSLRKVQWLGKGWLSWGLSMYDVTSSLQSQNAHGQACLLVGAENVLRIDAPQPKNPIRLDDWMRAKAELPWIAESLVRDHAERALGMFFQEPVLPYEPAYAPAAPPA